jgi:hypothetical protein
MNDSSFPSDEIDPGSARLYGTVARALVADLNSMDFEPI